MARRSNTYVTILWMESRDAFYILEYFQFRTVWHYFKAFGCDFAGLHRTKKLVRLT